MEDFTPEKVLAATRELMSDSYRLTAETYSRQILHQGGPRCAAELVLGVATRGANENEK